MSAAPEPDVHVVLLGDSTLDNGRYLCTARGELSVDTQFATRCEERGWDLTALAQDGSTLEDVRLRQLPQIPDEATHVVISASGNDLLALLNQMVAAGWSFSSMYGALGAGMAEVVERYERILTALKDRGCHVACCTVYRPNFEHLFFKSLATFSLGLHNTRIRRMASDLDCCVIDLAMLFDVREDFANPLELSTQGGAKVVQNVSRFVIDHQRTRTTPRPASLLAEDWRGNRKRQPEEWYTDDPEEDMFLTDQTMAGCMPSRCCTSRSGNRKVYASKRLGCLPAQSCVAQQGKVREEWSTSASRTSDISYEPLDFSLAQQPWRKT